MSAEWHDDKLFEELPSSISGEVASFLTREVFEQSDVFRWGIACTLDALPDKACFVVCLPDSKEPMEPCNLSLQLASTSHLLESSFLSQQALFCAMSVTCRP